MIKLSKTELKNPDKIWKASKTTIEWLTSHLGLTVVGLVAVLGIALGGTYWRLHSEGKEKKAQYHLAKAEKAFDQWVAAAAAEKAKFEEDLKRELAALQTDFPNSHTRELAKGLEARVASERKDWGAAIPLWKDYIKALPAGERDLARLSLAVSFENTNDWTRALAEYEGLAKNEKSFLREWALLGKARSLRQLNRGSEAKAVYEQFLKDFPESSEAAAVRGLLALTTN